MKKHIIGNTLKIPTILFNPALHSRSFDPDVNISSQKGTHHNIIFGINDDVIHSSLTKEYLNTWCLAREITVYKNDILILGRPAAKTRVKKPRLKKKRPKKKK